MTKAQLIDRLRWFAENQGRGMPDEYGHPDYAPSRGEPFLANLFARWLEESDLVEEKYSNWLVHLPQHVIAAYDEFATSPKWAVARKAYRIRTEHDLPDLVNVHQGGLYRLMMAHDVVRLLPLLTESPWLTERLASAINAQSEVIDHAWRRFVRVAYAKLMPRIKAESHRGNSGVLGTTTLMTWACAGRVMMTFQRGDSQMTYVCDDSDPRGDRSGPNTPGAPYAECVAMIEDVIAHWDLDKLQRSDTVGIG